MDVLGIENLNGITPEGVNKNERQGERPSPQEKPIYALKRVREEPRYTMEG
jgi:hypothetical protein